MRPGPLALSITLAAVVTLVVVKVPPSLKARAQRMEIEREHLLMEAIRKGDAASVEKLAEEPVDIYATDTTGESALSLAEKSGNAPLLAALKPLRNPQKDLWRAQSAADTGTSIGLQQPLTEREFDVLGAIHEEEAKARAEQRPLPTAEEVANIVERKIDALPEGERKEWALRNFATRLSERNLMLRAQDTARRLRDPKMRVDSLIYLTQGMRQPEDLQNLFQITRGEIDSIPDPGIRDPLYAQLAHFQKLRGYEEASKSSCLAIQDPQYRNGTCQGL